MDDRDDRKNGRTTDGRWAAGNPGRPLGARHKVSLILERVMAADGVAVAKAVVEAAKAGDMTAARLILDRLVPPRKGRPVALDLPAIANAADVLKAQAAVIEALSAGEVTPDEAALVAGVLEAQRRAVETVELEQRLAALEARAGEGGT